MSIAKKTGGLLLATTALCAVGAGTAFAETPIQGAQPSSPSGPMVSSAAQAKAGDLVIFSANRATQDVYDNPNDPTHYTPLQPGASLTYTAEQVKADFPAGQVKVVNTSWDIVDYITFTGYSPGVSSCNETLDTSVGCTAQVPNVLAGEDGPTQISMWDTPISDPEGPINLDAADPNQDKTAMGTFLTGMSLIAPGWLTFNPSQLTPISWGTGPQALAGSVVYNCGDGAAQETLGGQSSHSETTNLTTSLAVQQQVKLFDTVNTSITATVSFGKAWTDTTTTTQTVSKTVNGNAKGWLSAIPATETVHGAVTMTGNTVTGINFNNVTFSEPGRNRDNDPAKDYTYVAHSAAMTTDELAQFCGTGSNRVHGVVIGPAGQLPGSPAASAHTSGSQPATLPNTEPASRRTGNGTATSR